MKLDDGEDGKRSVAGASCSIFVLVVVILYTYLKVDVLVRRKDVDVLQTVNDYKFSDVDNFTYYDGFNVAVGFTAWDKNESWVLDPSYGDLVINSLSWGQHENGTFYINRVQLPAHNCTAYELGISRSNDELVNKTQYGRFLPFVSNDYDLELFRQKLICLEKKDMWLHGDFDSNTSRQINFQLRKCKDKPYCRSDQEILEFFSNKYLVILHNQILFDSTKQSEESIKRESRIKWIRINTQSR